METDLADSCLGKAMHPVIGPTILGKALAPAIGSHLVTINYHQSQLEPCLKLLGSHL